MEEKALTIAHSAFRSHCLEGRFGILVGVIVEMPSTLVAPSENAVVWPALVPFVEAAGCNMVSGYVRMLEFTQKLTREGSRTYEDDVLLSLPGHSLGNEINTREMRVIDRQAVVVLDPDPGALPVGRNPAG